MSLSDADELESKYKFSSKNYRSRNNEVYQKNYRITNFYHFPQGIQERFLRFLYNLSSSFQQIIQRMKYLGPLREFPLRMYRWGGDRHSLGNRGENAIQILLEYENRLGRHARNAVTEQIAQWMQNLGLIHSFRLHRIAPERREFEVRVQMTKHSPEVLLTEVGFGVSQVLPVLVACATATQGNILIFEQPEIHLHPAVQSGLADVFIETIKERNVQIILESHSEHLLRRLQRRIAEEKLESKDTALYFCAIDDHGESHLTSLDIDDYGNIRNWPQHFFGDEMGDLAAMTIAAIERQQDKAK